MAKIVITIEDNIVTGRVKAVCTPSFETMMKKVNAGGSLTSAEAYAVAALRRVLEAEKQQGPLNVLVPRVAHT